MKDYTFKSSTFKAAYKGAVVSHLRQSSLPGLDGAEFGYGAEFMLGDYTLGRQGHPAPFYNPKNIYCITPYRTAKLKHRFSDGDIHNAKIINIGDDVSTIQKFLHRNGLHLNTQTFEWETYNKEHPFYAEEQRRAAI